MKLLQAYLRINGNVDYTKYLVNDKGQDVKIVVRYVGYKQSTVDVYLKKADGEWFLCDMNKNMDPWVSQEHYIKHQRPTTIQALGSIGPVFKAAAEFKELINAPLNKFKKLGWTEREYKGFKFDLINLEGI